MQAIGYNIADGLVYGTDGGAGGVGTLTGSFSRFGLDLVPQVLLDGLPQYQTGDVDLQSQYWAARTADK